jgi:signal transduction histidine kinase
VKREPFGKDEGGTRPNELTSIRRETDVSPAREDLLRQLQQENEDLKRSKADLETFALIAAHEMKEPFATIRDCAAMIASRYSGRRQHPTTDSHLRTIIAVCDRLETLINDLLGFTQLTSSPLRLEVTSGEALLWMAKSQLQAQIEREHARITADQLPEILADQVRITRVLQNLISNAIKYRHPDRSPEIHISCSELSRKIQVGVSDNGRGIPKEQQESIFEMYRRLPNADVPGTGIGLALCRRIIERHGGRIWTESTPGKGSTFYFTLPCPDRLS